jgi:hypothetical protein
MFSASLWTGRTTLILRAVMRAFDPRPEIVVLAAPCGSASSGDPAPTRPCPRCAVVPQVIGHGRDRRHLGGRGAVRAEHSRLPRARITRVRPDRADLLDLELGLGPRTAEAAAALPTPSKQ